MTVTTKYTPEQVAALPDDELRLAVARKMFPDGENFVVLTLNKSVALHNRESNEVFERRMSDPLSPEGAFKLRTEHHISVHEAWPMQGVTAGVRTFDGEVVFTEQHPATEHGTARAVNEAFLLMGV